MDTVYANFRDGEGFLRDCREGAAMGFTGKLSIHPDQIDPINDAFAPTDAEVAEARALVEAFEEAQAEGAWRFRSTARWWMRRISTGRGPSS